MPQHRVEARNKFLRLSARIAVGLGAFQLIVRILGDVAVWLIHVLRAMGERPPVVLPDLPWGLWPSIVSFVVLTLVGAAFWKGQIGEPGRVIDLILGLIPGRQGNGNS